MKRNFVVKASCNKRRVSSVPVKGGEYPGGVTANDMNTASEILQRILDSDPVNLGMSADADYYLQAVIDELTNASYHQSSEV